MEKKILIVDDRREQVKEAIRVLELAEATRGMEGKALPIILEDRSEPIELTKRKIHASPFIPLMIGMMGVAAGYSGSWPQGKGPYFPEPPKRIKKCLQCGKEHTHNNSYCSAQCCKEHTNGQKILRRKK